MNFEEKIHDTDHKILDLGHSLNIPQVVIGYFGGESGRCSPSLMKQPTLIDLTEDHDTREFGFRISVNLGMEYEDTL